MSGAVMYDRQAFEVAFSEIEAVRKTLPEATLSAVAEEVVLRVAQNLSRLAPPDIAPSAQDIDHLTQALLSENPSAAATFIADARRKGSSYEALCLSYLAVAARRLGEMWDNDQVSFYRVTVAAGRMYAILRLLRSERRLATPDLRRAAVFASVPGEHHTLGITMAADLARDRGWDIELFVGLAHADLVSRLEDRQPSLIGLSASGIRSLPTLMRLIVALRISNPGTSILICGQIVTSVPSLVGPAGADAAALDFAAAIEQMERLRSQRLGRLI